MLKTTSAAGPATSIEIGDENLEHGGLRVQVKNRDKKEPAQKSCKSQLKGQKQLSLKSGSKPKKLKLAKLRTLTNQEYSLLPTLGEPLSN